MRQRNEGVWLNNDEFGLNKLRLQSALLELAIPASRRIMTKRQVLDACCELLAPRYEHLSSRAAVRELLRRHKSSVFFGVDGKHGIDGGEVQLYTQKDYVHYLEEVANGGKDTDLSRKLFAQNALREFNDVF